MAAAKSVDASLWWDPFPAMLTELENFPLSSDLPPHLLKKLKENRDWLADTLTMFKPPNDKSREALNSQKLKIGSHELSIKPELKDKALQISSCLDLDEVQSYILVERSTEHVNAALDSVVQEFPHSVLLQYYIERQCLLKCTRRILLQALCVEDGAGESNPIQKEALGLISAGLDDKLLALLEKLLSSMYPEQMDVDLFTLWAEETLTEDNLILEILFLIYYEPFCTCNAEKWKKFCSLYKGISSGTYNFINLAVSAEALDSSQNAKVQLLFVLIETLDLENLLQMVHDEMPFRQGVSAFSFSDIQEMDSIVSSFDPLEMRDAGPLFLAWAVFICLILSLGGSEDCHVLLDIDHVGYVRQAFETSSLNFFMEILQNIILKESDGSFAGHRSVLRTFMSAFIASYEINNQLEDSTFTLILDILCKIYRGEESLCMQFWDRASFIDGPVRCLLGNVEGEFPYRTVELVRLLSSLCDGSWSAECVYNFLEKSVGVSTLFEISDVSMVDDTSQFVETLLPLHVPGVEILEIPSKTRGHILRIVGRNVALVRWEYPVSGVLVLLLRLAEQLMTNKNDEVFYILDLLNRMVSFNTGICFSLMNLNTASLVQSVVPIVQTGQNMWIVEVISSLVRNLSLYPSSANAALISMGINILAKMLNCFPSSVSKVVLKVDIFDGASSRSSFVSDDSSSSWFLSGKLAKMLLIDCEHNDYDSSLPISVLEFTNQLVESGLESDAVHALLVFSLQYILVNHVSWKYKVRRLRWRVTLRVLELVRKCIISSSSSKILAEGIQNILLNDSSIHNSFFRIVCTTSQALEQLYVSRLIDVAEIEGLQLAVHSALDVLNMMLVNFSKGDSSSLSLFHQAMLSSTTRPIPVAAAVISLISYFRSPEIQVSALRVLSSLLTVASDLQHLLSGMVFFSPDDKQIMELKETFVHILLEQSLWDGDLCLATVDVLISAARFQPAFLLAIMGTKETTNASAGENVAIPESSNDTSIKRASESLSILDAILQLVESSPDLMKRKPQMMLAVLNFLKALWEGAALYYTITDKLKVSGSFWKHLSSTVDIGARTEAHRPKTWSDNDTQWLACSFHGQGAVLEVMAYNIFLQKKSLHTESITGQAIERKEKTDSTVNFEKSNVDQSDCINIFLKWSESSVLQSLVKIYSSDEYDGEVNFRAKLAGSLFAVSVMVKLTAGDAGSMSMSLLELINSLYKELSKQSAFSELMVQYSKHGYSEGKELENLILNDLYYHLQGEFEGRKIGPGPFHELFLFLVQSNVWQNYYVQKYEKNHGDSQRNINLFHTKKIRVHMNLNLWDCSNWKASIAIAETMLKCMEESNWMMIFLASKVSALKSFTALLALYEEEALKRDTTTGRNISDKLVLSCIDVACKSFHSTLRTVTPTIEASEGILKFLAAQAELIIHLIRKLSQNPPLPVCVLILRMSGSALKVFGDIKPVVKGTRKTMKFALMLLLLSLKFSRSYHGNGEAVEMDSVEEKAEFSNLCLGHIPILCSCLTIQELGAFTITALDYLLRNFLMPSTWFPIVQSHLPVQHIISKLHDRNSPVPSSIILNFLLTLVQVRGGAEMLLGSGLFLSLRALFSAMNEDTSLTAMLSGTEDSERVWGLGLAVVAAMIHSLGDTSSCVNIVNSEIPYFFLDKAHLVSHYLSAPDFPSSDDQDKKRPRAQKTQTALAGLKETEHILTLMCFGARHRNSWLKAMKEINPLLREKSIHLLAFISRGNQRYGEYRGRNAPFLCPPASKAEVDDSKKPPFVNSKHGWFLLSPLVCLPVSKFSSVSTSLMALVVKDRAPEKPETAAATSFSDTVALQIYRIAFLLLKFLCIQAEGAAKRAEDVGFIDLSHFPELPMPEILHGLQDQAIAIVTDLCEGSKGKQMKPESCDICLLLLQVLEMALHLELCVLHICGIRPVLGRVEDFSKEVKPFVKAIEGQNSLKPYLTDLTRMISLVYPGLLQAEGLL